MHDALSRMVVRVCLCALLIAGGVPAEAQQAAEVVVLQGTGDFRPDAQVDWRAARMQQDLSAGEFVRTGELSRMGMLFLDQTQIRLNQNTVMQIKQVSRAADASSSTVLGLIAGRAWSQSKQAPRKLLIETPSATAAIRGTDWELSVDAAGTTTVTVLSGEVEFFNDFGTVVVARNEAATAVVGQAPVKLLITNPRDRVQWVTAYAVDPLRHIFLSSRRTTELQQTIAAPPGVSVIETIARANALADLGRWNDAKALYTTVTTAAPANVGALLGLAFTAIHEGDAARATELIGRAQQSATPASGAEAEIGTLGRIAALIQSERFRPAMTELEGLLTREGGRQAAPYLLLSDLMLYMGETEKAIDYVTRGKSKFPDDERLESQLARIYLLADRMPEGRAQVQQALQKDPQSLEAYLALGDIAKTDGQAPEARAAYLAALALKNDDARAWYGLGAVENEREAIRRGRSNLKRALDLNPSGPGYGGELGTLETFANRLDQADEEYRRALATNPSDYVALTGLGLLELKRGRHQAALETLLRASLMEPRYARVHMYIAIAYYRLGRIDRALEELARASDLDPKDPFPHMLRSIIHNDIIDPGKAIAAGRTARDLMPNLKSLNQLANNQKGTANLGSAFAVFGMEEWALHLAQESYYPYWAGSHLFLGDRYAGSFNKNSEYFQGIIADPTAFGASTRYQTLVPKPGAYLNTGFRAGDDGISFGSQPYFTLNGYTNSKVPAAYFFDVERTHLEPRVPSVEATQNTYTAALGVSPTHELSAFGFGNYTVNTGRVTAGDLTDAPSRIEEKKLDVGGQYRLSPVSAIWVKVGRGRELTAIGGRSSSRAFDFIFGTLPIDVHLRTLAESWDVQLRHTFSIGGRHEISWGAERGDRDKVTTFTINPRVLPSFTIPTVAPVNDDSSGGYVSERLTLGSLLLQGDLFVQKYTREAREVISLALFGVDDIVTTGRLSDTTVEPRIGAVYHFAGGRLLRVAHQRSVRPTSVSTLAPVATVGIPVDDRLTALGGRLSRSRAQIEWEWTSQTFTSAFFDYKEVENLSISDTIEGSPDLKSLRRLRNVVQANLASTDLLEDTPDFRVGIVRSGGFAINQLLSDTWSVYTRYFATDSENTGEQFGGNRIPLLPEHVVALGTTWVGPRRLYVGGQLVHRTSRFSDEANRSLVPADWRGTVQGYWEVPSKRWSIEAAVSNLFSSVERVGYGIDLKFRY